LSRSSIVIVVVVEWWVSRHQCAAASHRIETSAYQCAENSIDEIARCIENSIDVFHRFKKTIDR